MYTSNLSRKYHDNPNFSRHLTIKCPCGYRYESEIEFHSYNPSKTKVLKGDKDFEIVMIPIDAKLRAFVICPKCGSLLSYEKAVKIKDTYTSIDKTDNH